MKKETIVVALLVILVLVLVVQAIQLVGLSTIVKQSATGLATSPSPTQTQPTSQRSSVPSTGMVGGC